jgi:UDP-N-acetylmuramate: L-alanyl-gamma-D-glutamyl-meso-diaminopimelate ligase
MGGLARILIESGHKVSGSDNKFYPPMSDQLRELDIKLTKGYEPSSMPKADLYVIGNVLSRENRCVEEILNRNLPYKSGPEILGEIIEDRFVIAVSGTHGKTTTSFMIAKIFQSMGKDIGYLIGGISPDFLFSAKIGSDEIFVIEADEYDSAFFDKRSKFIHYSPDILLINNIEFDHADIFNDLNEIKKQFHHLLKIIPSTGKVILFDHDRNALDVINEGCWADIIKINGGDDSARFDSTSSMIEFDGKSECINDLPFYGSHNNLNAAAAIITAASYGVNLNAAYQGLKDFSGVLRRLENKGTFKGITILDDFAHHPTAIKSTIQAVEEEYSGKKILNIIELGSNTMSGGFHGEELFSIDNLDIEILWLDHRSILENNKGNIHNSYDDLIKAASKTYSYFDIILIMTNKNSKNIFEPLRDIIEAN